MYMSMFYFILDIFTLGLASQFFLHKAPLGFQHPASIAFNNIIDFHDYIIIFLVFIFLLVLWHLIWALNLSKLMAPVLLTYLFGVCFIRFLYYQTWLFKQYKIIIDAWSTKRVDFSEYNKFINTFAPEAGLLKTIVLKNLNAVQYLNGTIYGLLQIILTYTLVLFCFLLFLLNKSKVQGSITKFITNYGNNIRFVNKDNSYVGFSEVNKPQTWPFQSLLDVLQLRAHYLTNLAQTKKLTHAAFLEIFWTIFPSFILLAIAVPSLILLYQLDAIEPISLCIKVIGHQWYWSYEIGAGLVLFENLSPLCKFITSMNFDSYMLSEDVSQLRLLEVDNPLFVPVGIPLTFMITSTDVIHSWAVPSLGVKVDAIPGRLNQVGVNVLESGVFYGQCSELCGINHGFMPINVYAYYNTSNIPNPLQYNS